MATHAPILAPSILATNHGNLAAGIRTIAETGLTWAHLDIMDGHFVPNLSFGPGTVAALRPVAAELFFDVHLMLDNPHLYVEAFAKAGANLISIHVEPDYDVAGTLQRIHDLGCQNGIVLNPGTPASAIEPFLDQVELVLAMTVQPGFGGQSFRHDVLSKLREIDAMRRSRGLSFLLEVDGGIDLETAPLCRAAGTDTFVAGTSFFKAADRTAFAAAFAAL